MREKSSALDISIVLDSFKDDFGYFDHEHVKEVANELSKFGPFYYDSLNLLVLEMAHARKKIIILSKG